MTRNPSHTLDFENALCRNLLPLRNGLGGHSSKRFSEGSRAASGVFGFFATVFHTPIESISFIDAQAFLSVMESVSFDIVGP